MNAESSRSHLIIGITIETINKTTGQVLTGKVRSLFHKNKIKQANKQKKRIKTTVNQLKIFSFNIYMYL